MINIYPVSWHFAITLIHQLNISVKISYIMGSLVGITDNKYNMGSLVGIIDSTYNMGSLLGITDSKYSIMGSLLGITDNKYNMGSLLGITDNKYNIMGSFGNNRKQIQHYGIFIGNNGQQI